MPGIISDIENVGKAVLDPLGAVVGDVKSLFSSNNSSTATMPNFPNTSAGTAAKNAWMAGARSTPSKGSSGGASITQGMNLTKATTAATKAITPNTSSTTSKAAQTAATTTANQSSSTGGNANPPSTAAGYVDPTIAAYTSSLNTAIANENSAYNQKLNDFNAVQLPIFNQTKTDQASAISNAVTSFYAANPHASATEVAEYTAMVSSSFDNTLAEQAAQITAGQDQISQEHAANVLSINSNYTSSVLAYNKQQTDTLNQLLTTNPPDPTQASSLYSAAEAALASDPNSSNPATQEAVSAFQNYMSPYMTAAMGSGLFPDEGTAYQYLLSPTLGEQKLQVSEETASADVSRAATAAGTLSLATANAGAVTTAGKPNAFQTIANDFSGQQNTTTTTKTPQVSIGGVMIPVGSIVTNSSGQTGIVNVDRTITPQ